MSNITEKIDWVTLPKTLSDHPSLVGIVRMPFAEHVTEQHEVSIIYQEDGKVMNAKQKVEFATNINGNLTKTDSFSVPKSRITDFFPYTYYILTDGECEPLILHPQYMPTSVQIRGTNALSNQPVERYFVPGYKNDMDGRIYNITNFNQMMIPTATNEGINFLSANANTIGTTRKNQITDNILTGVSGVVGSVGAMMSGNVSLGMMGLANTASNAISGINQIKEVDSRNRDQYLTPSSISSFGTPSTRAMFHNDEVRLIKYSVTTQIKTKILNYVNRFGNKYNNYGTIDIKSYKGYIKFISPNIDGKIDNMYISKIISILERGIYFE